jgi:hypothetical protein
MRAVDEFEINKGSGTKLASVIRRNVPWRSMIGRISSSVFEIGTN